MSSMTSIISLVALVRISCSDQLKRDEVTSLTYNSHLRLNVRVSAYFVQVQVQLAFERVHRVCNKSFGKLSDGVAIMLRNKCVLGLFLPVRSRHS